MERIVIWKTKIYHFWPLEDAQKWIDVFTQQMANVPVDDTFE